MLSPFPRDEPCGVLALWAYAPEHAPDAVPMRMDDILRELAETVRRADAPLPKAVGE